MRVSCFQVPDQDLTWISMHGILNPSWVKNEWIGITSKPLQPKLLINFSNADMSQLTETELMLITTSESRSALGRKRGQTALLTPGDLQFGLGRMMEAFSEFEEVPTSWRCFRSLEQATGWLNISLETLRHNPLQVLSNYPSCQAS